MTAEPSTLDSLRQSPVQGLAAELDATGSDATVRLADRPFLTQLDLRVAPDSPATGRIGNALGLRLPTEAGAVSSVGERYAVWCGPDWWLLVDVPGAAGSLEATIRAAFGEDAGSVTDVSSQRTALELSGPRARDVLRHGTSIDLHPKAFPAGTATQVTMAKAHVLLHHLTADPPTYRLLVRSSFAEYLATWLLDAMVEYVAS